MNLVNKISCKKVLTDDTKAHFFRCGLNIKTKKIFKIKCI